MRINRFIAAASGVSRRAADKLVQGNKVFINGLPAQLSDHATLNDIVKVNGKQIFLPHEYTTIVLNKPVGYVCSRDGQGSKTVYDLLPEDLKHLKTVGRLDKDSSGLLVMTDDGQLAHELTHPKFAKNKVYDVELNRGLSPEDADSVEAGIQLDDGVSKFLVSHDGVKTHAVRVLMQEGRNRQIRRTFSALDYTVKKLHRVKFGDYELGDINPGAYKKTS